MIKIISFDLDGTLVKPGFGDTVWLEGLPKVYAEEKQVSLERSKSLFIDEYDRIGSERREWYDLRYWINRFDLNITPKDLLDRYEHHIQLFDDVEPVITRLSKKYKLVIGSGAMQEFIQKELEYTKILQYFVDTFSSTSDTHTVKKDPAFYQMISKQLHCKPNNIVHIGDHLEYDYYAAVNAGLNGYFLDRTKKTMTSFTVTSLEEFEHMLNRE